MEKIDQCQQLMGCPVAATDIHQRSQTSIYNPCNGFISHGTQFGGFQVLPTKHAKTSANQCVHDLRMPWGVLRMFYLHPQTAVDAVTYTPDEPQLILFMRKNRKTPIQARTGIKMVQVLVSLMVCIYCLLSAHGHFSGSVTGEMEKGAFSRKDILFELLIKLFKIIF